MTQIKVNYEAETMLLLLKRDMHGRELAKELKTSLTRVQSILANLSKCNALDYRKQGKNHIYFIRKNLVARSFILNAENYKLAKLLSKYPFLEPLFDEIAQKCPGQMIVLFGSYAKFIPKDESDVDLYIDTSNKRAKEAVSRIDERINVKIGEFDKESLLIQEIIKNHIIVRGVEDFYEKLRFFK